jgi:WD40 repeat protein
LSSSENEAFFVRKIRKLDAGSAIFFAAFVDVTAVFATGEGLIFLPQEGDVRRASPHDGAILCACAERHHVATGGDDGQVCLTGRNGKTATVATDAKHRWIDRVALRGDVVAWSAGKQAFVQAPGGDIRTLQLLSSIGGLAFAPENTGLAVAHYNGVTLWHPLTDAAPTRFEWKGLHLDVRFSPDGQFVVTTMQEPAIHAWRLADKTNLPVPSYPERVRSIDWSPNGRWLATSGSERLVLLPFNLQDNPMARMPLLLAPYHVRVSAVAYHPTREIVAVGYADGLALLVRVPDGAEILLKNPGPAPVSALAWNTKGHELAIACEDGAARVLELS